MIENVRINMQKRKKTQSPSSSTTTSTPTTSEKTSSSSSNYSTPVKKEVVDLTNDDDGWVDSAKEFDEPASTTSMKPPRKDPIDLYSNPKKRGRGFLLENEAEDEQDEGEDDEDEEDEEGAFYNN